MLTTYLVVGSVSGLIMAALFLFITPLMLFFLSKSNPPWFIRLASRISLKTIMMCLVLASYPVWVLTGMILALLLFTSESIFPKDGLGSSNLLFTLTITIGASATMLPFSSMRHGIIFGPIAITLSFIGIFGWVMPLLSQLES